MKYLLSLLLTLNVLFAADRPVKPNILLVFVDDLGWQDVKCYDVDEPSPMETPYFDALAKRGVQFLQAYSPAPTCAPSRCALMSGVHPARSQKTTVVGGKLPLPSKSNGPVIEPWYSGRIVESAPSLAQTLKDHGYVTGHTGKWHMAVDHHASPQPPVLGFDFTTHKKGSDVRGVQKGMKDRLAFSTKDSSYPLDKNGYPTDPITEESLRFMAKNKDKPFFLYNATWLVHTPIQSRSKEVLAKYCEKLRVEFPTDSKVKYTTEGQVNPFYCAMVDTLDYYTGKLIAFLDETDDPRWPGHKLSENTYIIFTSDNGGAEGSPNSGKGVITDNFPLDRGKSASKEGGIRVPFIVAGPGIQGGVKSNTLVNALDLYPTILSWTGAEKKMPLDGDDLSTLLAGDAKDPTLVKDASGAPRKTMLWHFPHPSHYSTAIRNQTHKLILNYGSEYSPELNDYELYELYTESGERVDIEEQNDVASANPEIVASLKAELLSRLDEMDATRPYKNPASKDTGDSRELVPTSINHKVEGENLSVTYSENGAQVEKAYLYYTSPKEDRTNEWFRKTAEVSNGSVSVVIPKSATIGFVSLIDENNFLTLYPSITKKDTKRIKERAIKLK